MVGVWRERRSTGRALALAALAVWGCRAPVVFEGGLYRGREGVYAIAAPRGVAGPWVPARVPPAALAFRGPQGETMSLATRCTSALAAPRILARHLRFELPEHRLRTARDRQVAGVAAFEQVLEVRAGERPLDVETVTLVSSGCILDLVLVAPPGRFPDARQDFEAWLGTLRLAPEGPT